MYRTARRVTSTASAAAIALATFGLAAPATAAPAETTSTATSAQDCLNTLLRARFANHGRQGVVLTPGSRTMTAYFHVADAPACRGITASIGISRPDGSRFRSQPARVVLGEGVVSPSTDFTMGWTDTGHWSLRQIAVKKDGVTAVRGFAPQTSDQEQVRRGVVLTGVPNRPVNGVIDIKGTLKAYSTTGQLANLHLGREILLQTGKPGTGTYENLWWAATNPTGQYSFKEHLGRYAGDYLRVEYRSRYTTIASGYAFLGRIPAS